MRHCRYPKKITTWEDFEQQVKNFQPEKLLPGKAKYKDVLREYLQDSAKCKKERKSKIMLKKESDNH
jgi:phosphoribosylformylglycinamidine (FGAM) synthase-like enzyme